MAPLVRFGVRWSPARIGGGALALLVVTRGIAGCGSDSSRGIGYEVAFQAKDGHLWTVGSNQHGDWGFEMKPGTSPSGHR